MPPLKPLRIIVKNGNLSREGIADSEGGKDFVNMRAHVVSAMFPVKSNLPVQSVASQFEIVSLIFVRGLFKGVAAVEDMGAIGQPSAVMIPVMTDVCAGLFMFLLVTVFQQVSQSRRRADVAKAQTDELRLFIIRKKGVALALTVWLLVSLDPQPTGSRTDGTTTGGNDGALDCALVRAFSRLDL